MNSKKYLLKALAAFGLLLLAFTDLSATHFMGVDITYECLDSCNYRIYHNTYYDCSGAATPTPVGSANPPGAPFSFNFIGNGFCSQPTPIQGSWVFVSYVEVTPICPTFSTECDGGTSPIPGVAEARYYRDYNFCNTTCTSFTLQWSNCCRNNSITSVSNPGSQSIYSGSTVINLTTQPCNSSPQFTNPPIPYICSGQPFTFNQGAFDPDGDSLVYSLGPCFDDANTPLPLNPGFTPTQPMGPSWNTTIDPFTGDITLTPQPGQPLVAVLCVYVEEYRNGVKIGEVFRDVQITVIDCSLFGAPNTAPQITQLTNLTPGATANGLTVTTCACEQVCFDIPVVDPDTNQTWTLYWNNALPGTFFNAATGLATDTIVSPNVLPTGRFCWVPTKTGPYQFLVTVVDDGCPLLGINQYSIVINVNTCSLNPVAIPDRIDCYTVEYDGVPCGGLPPFTYQWTGNGGLSGSTQNYTHTYPGPGLYTYTLTITDSTGTSTSTTGTINLQNSASADAGPDLTLCPGEIGTVGTPAVSGYSYSWFSLPSNIGFNAGTNKLSAQPTVRLDNQTSATIPVQFIVAATDQNGCVAFDTTTVQFTPKPNSSFNSTLAVCVDENAVLQYTSIQAPGQTYSWDFGGGTVVGLGNGPGPHQVSWSTPGIKTVRLWTERNGCTSDTTVRTVLVNPIPTSAFVATSPVCAGQPASVSYQGTASASAAYSWDFDGGAGSGGQGPFNVTWPAGSPSGVRTISLFVTENGCVSPVTTQQVQLFQVPTATFSIPADACVDEPIQISYNGNASNAASYAWNFDGGTVISGGIGPGPHVVSWPGSGPRTVCLQVEENGCVSQLICETINIKATPIASISPVNNQCFNGNSFTFQYTGDPNVSSYNWDFGQGATPPVSTSATPPAVSYQTPGVKVVSLVVERAGCISDTAQITFTVSPEPSADFVANTGSICTDGGVSFTYTGTPVLPGQSYAWNFGTGAVPPTSSLANPPVVSYTTGGAKTVTLTVSNQGCTTTSSQTIQVTPVPIVDAGLDVDFCEGEGGAQLNSTVTGGTAPIFYSWWCDNPPNCGLSNVFAEDPTANPTVAQPTDSVRYYVQVTDVNGCSSRIDSAWVIVKAKPKLDAGPDVFICEQGPGAFLAGGPAANNNAPLPISYQWLPAQGLNNATTPNPFARPDTTTIYTLVGTSANGCSSEVNTLDTLSTATVFVKPLPIADAGRDTTICEGESLILQGFASGVGPNYTYSWTAALPGTINDPTLASPTVTPPFTTTYTLVVSSNGCDSESDSITVRVEPRPTASAGADQTICLFDSVRLNGSGGGPSSGLIYQWSPSTGLSDAQVAKPLASPAQTTTYTLQVSTPFGCASVTDSMTVFIKSTPEVSALTSDTVICEGDTLTLEATHVFNTPPGSPVVYNWEPAGEILTSPAQATVLAAPTRTTRYRVSAGIAGDCATEDFVLVTVHPKIEAAITADTSQICSGEVINASVSGGQGSATYQWLPTTGVGSPNAATTTLSPADSTTYRVIVEEGSCSDTASFALGVTPSPVADYVATTTSGCAPLTVAFLETGQGGTAYRWDFGDGSALSNEPAPSHTYANPGTYPVTLTLTGPGGCEDQAIGLTVQVSDNGFADFSSDPDPNNEIQLPNAEVQFSDQSTNGVAWYWEFGDGESASGLNPSHTYREPGDYTVTLTVTNRDGCVATVSYGPYRVVEADLLIPNVFTPNGDGSNDAFVVKYDGKEDFAVELFDRWGRKVYASTNPNEGWDGTDQGATAKEGVYFYTVKIGERAYQGNVTLMR